MLLLEGTDRIVKDVVAVAIAEIEKTCLVITETAKAMVLTAQVQQKRLPGRFVVLLLCMGVELAVLLSAVLQ